MVAYGATVYLAVEYQNGDASSKLVFAKTTGKWHHWQQLVSKDLN